MMRFLIVLVLLSFSFAACVPEPDSALEPVDSEIAELDYKIDENLTERQRKIRKLEFDPVGERNPDGSLPRNVLDFRLGDPKPLAARTLKRGLSIQTLGEEGGDKVISVFAKENKIHHIRTVCRMEPLAYQGYKEIEKIVLERYGKPHQMKNQQLIYLDKETMISFSVSYRKLLVKIYDLEANEFPDEILDLIDQNYETLQ